jgi:hypothetical protein
MPVPLLANSVYSEEMKWLRNFKGFGGALEINPEDQKIPRFVRGAIRIQDFSTQKPVSIGVEAPGVVPEFLDEKELFSTGLRISKRILGNERKL